MVNTINEIGEIKNRGRSHKAMMDIELAETMLLPDKVAPLHNAYALYLSKSSNASKITIEKFIKSEAQTSQIKKLNIKLKLEIEK
jgi:hypothetical protein